MLPGDNQAGLAQPCSVRGLLARWVAPEDVEIERIALYTLRSAVATRWHKGRLLIAGDAANLTWKLNLVLR